MASNAGSVTQVTLKSLLEAFNRHDLDVIMEYFADDRRRLRFTPYH